MGNKRNNVRETALRLLESVEKNQAYSNLLLNKEIEKGQLDGKDAGLLTELLYGTLQRRRTLDFYLEPFLKKNKNKKLEPWILPLLRMTLYQMLYLDRIPDRAAIFESVEIAKRRGHKGIASMVNGILRSIQREGVPSLETIKDPAQRLAVETSHPEWLIRRWIEQFGYEATKEMCEINLTAPLQTARVNLTKGSVESCIEQLKQEGFEVERSAVVPEAVKCLKGNLASSKAFKQGLLTIQDESSMLAAHALDVRQNKTILDACAAPGGKSTHIGEMLNHTGSVVSLDLHGHKVKLIAENAGRLGLANISPQEMDARKAGDHFKPETFDRILLDAPCSGLGVMRRKPDMKDTKQERDLDRLQEIQLSLLEAVSPLLKKGGVLVYSTCTVDKMENHDVVRKFLDANPDFYGDSELAARMPESVRPLVDGYELQILPQYFGSDGFYIASLKRKVD